MFIVFVLSTPWLVKGNSKLFTMYTHKAVLLFGVFRHYILWGWEWSSAYMPGLYVRVQNSCSRVLDHRVFNQLLLLEKIQLHELYICSSTPPPLIRPPLLPRNSVLTRDMFFGERKPHVHSKYLLPRICALSTTCPGGVSSLECPFDLEWPSQVKFKVTHIFKPYMSWRSRVRPYVTIKHY